MVWKPTTALLVLVVALCVHTSLGRAGGPPLPPKPLEDGTTADRAPRLRTSDPALRGAGASSAAAPGDEEGAVPDEARIDVAQRGALRFRGRAVDRESLVSVLARYADGDRDESTDPRVSRRAVRVVADPAAPWEAVLFALSQCTAPTVRIARLRLTAGATERIAVDESRLLPPGLRVKPEERPRIAATLDLGRILRVRLLDQYLGRGDAACEILALRVRQIIVSDEEWEGELTVAPDVPAAEVVRVLGIYRRAGVPGTHLTGVPPRQREALLLIRSLASGATDRIDELVEAMVRAPYCFFGQWELRGFLEGRPEVEREVVVRALLRAVTRDPYRPPIGDAEATTASQEALVSLGAVAAKALGREARAGSVLALEVLTAMGDEEAAGAREDVLTLASSPVDELRHAAVRALAAIGERRDARVAVVLERIADDPWEDADTRRFARSRLRWIRPDRR